MSYNRGISTVAITRISKLYPSKCKRDYQYYSKFLKYHDYTSKKMKQTCESIKNRAYKYRNENQILLHVHDMKTNDNAILVVRDGKFNSDKPNVTNLATHLSNDNQLSTGSILEIKWYIKSGEIRLTNYLVKNAEAEKSVAE